MTECCLQLTQEATQLGSSVQPGTIAAILMQSLHNDVRRQTAVAKSESEETPVPLCALTSESLSLLKQLKATAWAVQLDKESASLLSELCVGADRWADAVQIFEQRKTVDQVISMCSLSACMGVVRWHDARQPRHIMFCLLPSQSCSLQPGDNPGPV